MRLGLTLLRRFQPPGLGLRLGDGLEKGDERRIDLLRALLLDEVAGAVDDELTLQVGDS